MVKLPRRRREMQTVTTADTIESFARRKPEKPSLTR